MAGSWSLLGLAGSGDFSYPDGYYPRWSETLKRYIPDPGGGGSGITELTGDVVAGPGSGSQTATIQPGVVSYAKMQDVSAASRLLGRGDSGSGDVQEIVLGSGLTMTGTTLSASAGGGTVTNTGTLTANKAIIGNGGVDVTVSAATGVAHLAAGVLTGSNVDLTSEVTGDLPFANFVQASGASKLVGRGSAGGAGDFQEITLGSNLSLSGTTLNVSGSGGGVVDFGFTEPVDADFSWQNQGGASVTVQTVWNYANRISLRAPVSATASLRMREQTAPATPWTVTAAFVMNVLNMNFQTMGLFYRQNSDGKVATIEINGANGGMSLSAQKYTNATTFSANYVSRAFSPWPVVWIRISDNGTNRVSSYSNDGVNWTLFHSITRTDFLTADRYGFFCNDQTNTYEPVCTLLSWLET